MQDTALRAQTASELLSLDEEYAMQASWMKDSDSKEPVLKHWVL